jgi:hypothetical protein
VRVVAHAPTRLLRASTTCTRRPRQSGPCPWLGQDGRRRLTISPEKDR